VVSQGLIARTQTWVALDQQDDQAPVFATLPAASGFDPATGDFDWDAQQDVSRVQTWFQLDTESWVPLPGLTVASIDQQSALWPEQPGQESPVLQVWHAPDAAHAPPILTVLYPLDASLTGDLWHDQSHQQARSVAQTWFAPDADAFVPQPPVTIFNPASVDWAGDQQMQAFGLATSPTWETGGETLPATPPTWIDSPLAAGVGVLHITETWPDPAPGTGTLATIAIYRDSTSATASALSFAHAVLVGTVGPGAQTFDDYVGDLADYPADVTFVGYWALATNSLGLTSLSSPVNAPQISGATGDTAFWWYPLEQPPLPDQTQHWFAPDLPSDGFVPIAAGPTPPTTAQLGGLWQDPAAHQLPVPWLFADNLIGIDATPEFDPTVNDFGYDAQQDRDQTQRWFAPDESEWHPTATGDGPAPGGFSPALVGGGWDAQQDRSTQATWFAPEPDARVAIAGGNFTLSGVITTEGRPLEGAVVYAYNADDDVFRNNGMSDGTGAFAISLPAGSYKLWVETREPGYTDQAYSPDQSYANAYHVDLVAADRTVNIDLVGELIPVAVLGYDAQQDRSTAQLWFTPELDTLANPSFLRTTASVPQQAPFWYDQQPWVSNGARWVHPDDGWLAQKETIPLVTPPTIDQLSALWQEQPGQERSNVQTWYSPGVEPVDGPLQSWLFTTGSPGGAAPAVLIDATTGDVYLSIGGVFIVPAS
jgi:hypothetical protein